MRNLSVYPVTATEIIQVVGNVQQTIQDEQPMKFGDIRPLCLRYLLEFAQENKLELAEFLAQKQAKE